MYKRIIQSITLKSLASSSQIAIGTKMIFKKLSKLINKTKNIATASVIYLRYLPVAKRCENLFKNSRSQYKIWIWAVQGTDQVHGYKDCPNCLIPAPTMVVAKKIYDF